MRFVIRFLGLVLFAAAFLALVADGTKSLAAGRLVTTPLADTWYALSPASIDALQALVETRLHPYIWTSVVLTVLSWPTFAVGGLVGILLMLLGSGGRSRAIPV